MGDKEAVKVIVRCRPMNDREKNLKCKVRGDSFKKGQQKFEPSFDSAPMFVPKSYLYSLKKRAARGWNPAYQGSCIDPNCLSYTFDPTPDAPRP